MSTETSFERYEMLLERQSITRTERLALKASLDVLDTKIKNLIAHVKNRPRESDEELVKRLHDAEVYHSTHPQTNKDEREFMRELKVLKNKRKELVEYNVIQSEIDELKSKRSSIQQELKEKELCLDELYAGARKMRAAHKLNCDPNTLQEESMIVPRDKFGLVVGPAGSNVKKMEDECFVCIDLERGRPDSSEGKLKLYYDPSHNDVDRAKSLINIALDTCIEEWTLTNEKITCMLNKRATIVLKLQEMYDVRIDISKSKLLCKVTGLSGNVTSVVTAINSLEVAKSTVDLVERRVVMYILGKGRPIFNNLLEEYSVDIHLDRDGSPPTATVVGSKSSVVSVTKFLKQLVEENKEIEDELTCDKHAVLDAIIGTRGLIISQLQRDYSVRLTVDKEKSTTTHATIEIKGNAMNVKTVKEHILERINTFQSETVVISIPDGLLPGILGKKGARISALRQKHPEVTIDVVSDSNSMRFHSSDPVQRLSAVDEVEKYIAANMQKDFDMKKSTTITLKGSKGAEARKHLTETLHLNIDIDTDNEVIHIRGRNPDIDQAIQYLSEFCENFFEDEIECIQDDAVSLLNGKDDSVARLIENKFGIQLYYSKKNDLFRVVGHREAVCDAKQYITDFLEGAVENSALVAITTAGIGALVGRGGNHIKSFEKKHDVRVDVLKPRDQVRIHGLDAEKVSAAKLNLLEFLDNLIINVTVEDIEKVWAGRCETVSGSLDELLNKAKAMYGVGLNKFEKNVDDKDDNAASKKMVVVTFFGTPRCANSAKDFVLDEIRGVTTTCINVLPHHIEELSTDTNLAKLEKCGNNSHVSLSLSDSSIVLSGPVGGMAKAKIQVNRLLDYLFTGEFSSVVADSRSLLALWNFATELDFKNQVAGGHISFDMRMSCIRVYASTSVSHTLGVEYIRNAINECKKRVAMVEVSADVFNLISSKKSVYFGPIENNQKCKLAVQVNVVEAEDGIKTPQHFIVVEGPTEGQTKEGADALKSVIERLQKENWKISLMGDTVGALIGKGGKNVKALREETKANINIDMRTGTVEVNGKEDFVEDAKNRILQFVEEKEKESHVTYVPITPDCIPRVIGTKGATIRELRVSSQAVAIDIDRQEYVIVVKGTIESGQKAREDIIALLLKDNIDITKLRYVSPEERKAAAQERAKEEREQSVSVHKETTAPAVSRDGLWASLNRPGISKSAVRRIKRKIRDEQEHLEQQKQQDGDGEVNESELSNGYNNSIENAEKSVIEEKSSQSSTAAEGITSVKLPPDTQESPSSVVEPAFAFKKASEEPETFNGALGNIHDTTVNSSQPKSDSLPKSKPVSIPQGAAGNLLSMILGTTPVTTSANRLCSPRAMASGGYNHGAIGSVSRSLAAPISTTHAVQRTEKQQASSSGDGVPSTYYRSKTGRAIRLD